MVMEGDLTWGGEHKIQCTDHVFSNCTLETNISVCIRGLSRKSPAIVNIT